MIGTRAYKDLSLAQTGTTGELLPQDTVIENHQDGTACVTSDGQQGTWQGNVCVPNAPEPKVEAPKLPAQATPTQQATQPMLPRENQALAWYQQPNAIEPVQPERYQNPYGSALEIYDKYGIPHENVRGSAFGEAAPGYTKPAILDKSYFDHNVPLGIWTPGNTIYQASDETEFVQMVQFAEKNQKYLPDELEQPNIQTFADLQNYVAIVKPSPEKEQAQEQLKYWQMQGNLLTQYESDRAKYEEIIGNEPEGITSNLGNIYKQRLRESEGRYNRYTQEEIGAQIKQAERGYAEVVNKELQGVAEATIEGTAISTNYTPKHLFSMKLSTGWQISGNNYKSPEGEVYSSEQMLADPALMSRFYESIPKKDINDLKAYALVNSDTFGTLLRQAGDTPVTRAILRGLYPEMSDEEVSAAFSSTSMKAATGTEVPLAQSTLIQPETGYPYNRPPSKLDEFLNIFVPWKSGIDTPENFAKRQIAGMLSSEDIPNRVKNFAVSSIMNTVTGGALPAIQRALNLFDTYVKAWNIGVSSAFRDQPYELWKSPTLKPARPWVGDPFDVTLKGIIDWSNPAFWFTGTEGLRAAKPVQKLIAETASDIIKGTSRDVIINRLETQVRDLGIDSRVVLDDAEKLVQNEINHRLSPKEFTMNQTREIKPGEVVPENARTDANTGITTVDEPKTFRKIEPGKDVEPLPENKYVDPDTKQVYGKVEEPVTPQVPKAEPEVPTKPPEGATPKAEGGTTTPKPVETPKVSETPEVPKGESGTVPPETPKMAEIDTKLSSVKSRISEATNKGIWEKGTINDPEVRQAYRDLVEAASLYVQKGILTVEEFAKELGIKVTDLVKQAWDDIQAITKQHAEWTPEQRASVLNFRQAGDDFGRIWDTISAERQVELSKKAGKLEAAIESNEGAETVQAAMGALKGKLFDMGLDKSPISPADLDNLINITRESEIKVFDKAVVMRALERLQQEFRVPRPYEMARIKEVFGDAVVKPLEEIINKPRLGDYINEIYYNSLLTVKSNIPNTVGNTIAALFSPIERGVAAAIERPLAAISGRPRTRFFGEAAQDLYGAWSGIPEGVRNFLDVMKSGKASVLLKGEVKGEAFKGAPGAVINFNSRFMTATDQLFRSINSQAALRAEAYRMAASEKLTGDALRLRVNELVHNPPETLYKKAEEITKYRLYQDPNQLSNILLKLRDIEAGKGIQPFRFIIPFVRTPVNLVKFGLQRSPVAMLNPQMWSNLLKKKPEAADELGRAIIGSTISTALFIYAKDGNITGAAPTTQGKRDAFYREGKQPYSLRIGNKWISYQRLEPFNQMFVQVANVVDAIEKGESDKKIEDMAWKAATSFGQNLVSQNFLTGISDTMNAIGDPDRYGEQWIQRLITGLIPYSGTQRIVAQSMDTTIRSPQDIGQAVQAQTPGLSQNVPAKINVFGEEQKRETPAWEPYTFTTEKNDKVTQVLNAAGVTPGFAGNSITENKKTYKLNDEELNEYRTLTGQVMYDALSKVVNRGVTDASKLESTISTARDDARKQMLKLFKQRNRQPD